MKGEMEFLRDKLKWPSFVLKGVVITAHCSTGFLLFYRALIAF